MSVGPDNIGDQLDDPNFKMWSRQQPRPGGGTGGTGGPAPGQGGGWGSFFGQTAATGPGGWAARRGGVRAPVRRMGMGGSLPGGGSGASLAFDDGAVAAPAATAAPQVGGVQQWQRQRAQGWGAGIPRAGAPAGFGGGLARRPMAPQAPRGGGGSAFDPSNPFGNPLAGGSESEDFANWLMQQGGLSGAFNPSGNSALMESARATALASEQASANRARNAAQLYAPGDTAAQGYAALRSELDSGNNMSAAVNGANAEQLRNAQERSDWLLRSRIGADQQWRSNDQSALLGRIGQGEARRGAGGGFGGWLGNVAGDVASSWLSRPGG